jgi:hypothetical protein
MSSIETLREHPRRLSAAAYAPFGNPIDFPPAWSGPPLPFLARMPGSSGLANYVTYASSRTPPPAYSDDGGGYDRPVFLDYDEDEGSDLLERKLISSLADGSAKPRRQSL